MNTNMVGTLPSEYTAFINTPDNLNPLLVTSKRIYSKLTDSGDVQWVIPEMIDSETTYVGDVLPLGMYTMEIADMHGNTKTYLVSFVKI